MESIIVILILVAMSTSLMVAFIYMTAENKAIRQHLTATMHNDVITYNWDQYQAYHQAMNSDMKVGR